MKLTGNTVFVTGGGSGIGRGLATALHRLDNQVIVSGRRIGPLIETTQSNPGMGFVELDIANPASIAAVSQKLIAEYPRLNVLVNTAGIMYRDDAAGVVDADLPTSTVSPNLLGFVPMASAAVYSSTKAAMHSCTQSLRYSLRGGTVTVQEIAPPWVQTDLLDSRREPRAMPLNDLLARMQ